MKTDQQPHPAIAFGAWLKAARQTKGFIARVFASKAWLSPSKYAEVEFGVVKWIGKKQEAIIPILLDFAQTQLEEFKRLLTEARNAAALTFDTLFNKEDLKPVRAAHSLGKQITLEQERVLLDVVFQPLA